jgi:hypothetical protein
VKLSDFLFEGHSIQELFDLPVNRIGGISARHFAVTSGAEKSKGETASENAVHDESDFMSDKSTNYFEKKFIFAAPSPPSASGVPNTIYPGNTFNSVRKYL